MGRRDFRRSVWFSWQRREIKGFQKQGSRGDLCRREAESRPALGGPHCVGGASHSAIAVKDLSFTGVSQQLFHRSRGSHGRSPPPRGTERRRAREGARGRRARPTVGGLRSPAPHREMIAAAPPPDASGSASPGRACSAAERLGRGGSGAGLRAAMARGGGRGLQRRGGVWRRLFSPRRWCLAFDRGCSAWRSELLLKGAIAAGGSQEGRSGAGSGRGSPWSSAAAMSAQCCAGQVSGGRARGR